ncbi:hypothetical protein CTEN210_18339 [Chaetoceros tenuissimus]|uniref:2Fe-2S ferredoxin-type domain-containing protein n=1 Tax=Chaetoceros tenuissimus TaxID=426638 RepID=A0AAD3HG74_9STRA|nr:hypothetical protein CTEN210_18339 [Chaetoceros tenuissimus]
MSLFYFSSLIILFVSLSTSDAFLIPSTKTAAQLQSSNSNTQETQETQETPSQIKSYSVKLTHQSKTINVQIPSNQTILQALESQNVKDALSLPDLPQDCRRGNCLTCSSRILQNKQGVVLQNDGLSPSMAQRIENENIVLTCSSFVKGEGIHLELGVCDDVWREMYGSSVPYEDLEGERIVQDAVAKAMRLAGEKNFNKWVVTTEKMLVNNNDDDDGFGDGEESDENSEEL